jgi:catechol 1,2-dioxygenase
VIEGPDSVTDVVLRAMATTPDARLREIMEGLVRHLHAFLREARLTPEEFERAVDFLVRLGQSTGAAKNEVILASDLVGASTLAMLLDAGHGTGSTDAALLGPFFRGNAPRLGNGANIAKHAPMGKPLLVRGRVRDLQGRALEGVAIEVWQASPVGLYENQDPEQPEHNLRGRFETDPEGRFHFHTVKPAGYPVPMDGPCGELLRAQHRHPYRPAHIHFLFVREGYRTLVTQVFDNADEAIESDVVFGVTPALSGDFRAQSDGTFLLEYTFVMQPGESRMPRPPIP